MRPANADLALDLIPAAIDPFFPLSISLVDELAQSLYNPWQPAPFLNLIRLDP